MLSPCRLRRLHASSKSRQPKVLDSTVMKPDTNRLYTEAVYFGLLDAISVLVSIYY